MTEPQERVDPGDVTAKKPYEENHESHSEQHESLLQTNKINREVAKPLQKRETLVITQTIDVNCRKGSHM